MPMYGYHCSRCGWEGDRKCAAEERDDQCCESILEHTDEMCGYLLTREEIPLDQAKMNHNWGNWR
jgi:hypothetical protein